MRDWFESLQVREQMFVAAGAAIVVVAVLWGLVWAPLDARHDSLRQSVDGWQRSLEELRPLRAAAERAGPAQLPAQAAGGQAPIVIVDQTLNARGLSASLKRSQPTPNGIRVEFENVAFDDLVLWLGDLSAGHGLEVQAASLSVAARNAPGRINASVTLERLL